MQTKFHIYSKIQLKFCEKSESRSTFFYCFKIKFIVLFLGNWTPVEIKQHPLNRTGGIYQLKQGQSRQIRVTFNQTHPSNIMWYNGLQFNFEPHKVDQVSVGCVYGKEIGVTVPLDSYQEHDLNLLKEKCKQVLENRKLYLYSQLKHLSDESNKSEEEVERYESLCKQLVELGEEQAAIDAPADNSGLPGSTIDWQPPEYTEKHVPIIFLKTDEDIDDQNNTSDYEYNEISHVSNESDDSEDSNKFSSKKNKKANKKVCGKPNLI